MIKKIRIEKNANKSVTIYYESGLISSYAFNKIPATAMDFILEEDTIPHENEWFQWYTK